MKVLVACEYSGRTRRAFEALGHDVLSCDIEHEAEDGASNHYKGDVFDLVLHEFDLMIAHPPCDYLTNAANRWYYDPETGRPPHPDYPHRWADREKAIKFFNRLKAAPIERICLENSQPSGFVMAAIGRYTQKVQPWMFGEPYTKGACLWLKNLKRLVPTHERPDKIYPKCHYESPGPDRKKNRSRTYKCIAEAFAEQWGTCYG